MPTKTKKAAKAPIAAAKKAPKQAPAKATATKAKKVANPGTIKVTG